MKRVYFAALLIAVSLVLFNCQKEASYTNLPGTSGSNPQPLTATLQGNIVDENGLPAAGVNIQVGTKSATTDAKGYFRIMDAGLDKNNSLVIADKPGYFKAFRSFMAKSGTNHIMIKLIKKELIGTISSSSGGEVTLSNGAKIALPANGVVETSGSTSYSGTINIYASYIDPTAEDIAMTVPGSLMADNKENKRVTLASYGMLAVELESGSGKKLQIAQGSSASFTTPIPASLQSTAPSSIALWHLDEATGIWKEEGSATKNNSNYTGIVKHFSFWNCDIGIPAVTLSATLQNSNGSPIVHGWVRVTRTVNNWSTSGWTDTLGQVSGLVPANENLVFQVLDPCGFPVFTQNIGPLTQNTDLGTLAINSSTTGLLTVKGVLTNCSGAPVTQGYAFINYDNMPRYGAINNSGEFSVTFIKCSTGPTAINVIAVDEASQQQGNPVFGTIAGPILDMGYINACGISTAEYINYTLDAVNYSISSTNAGDSLIAYNFQVTGALPWQTMINGFKISNNDNISLSFASNASTGTFDLDNLAVQNFDSVAVVAPSTVAVTNYPATAGGFYEGNFTAQFTSFQNPSTTHYVSGIFRIRRRY